MQIHLVSTTKGSSKKTNAATLPQTSSKWKVLCVDHAVYVMFIKHCYTVLNVEPNKIHEHCTVLK